MAKFTSNVTINTRWRNNDFIGAAGSTHTFPDAFFDEFLIDWKEQLDNGNLVITETPTTGNIQVSSLTVGDITLTGTALGFPGSPTITGTSPINVVTASGTSTISLNANYQTAGTYVTSIAGTSPITTSGTTAITVGIDQAAITGATAATNAQVVRFFVKNTTGTTIPKGSAVYVSGATGDNALISLASATSEASSSKTLGITAEAIATDAFGYVIEAGYLTNIDTSATTAGAAVWLGNTPGSLVFVTPPAEPSHAVYLGVVVRVQSMNGSILVKVQNGYELDELHDVSAASPSDGDIIQYKTSSSLWTKSALVDSVTSTSTTAVPTANAVRIANNAATDAQSTANGKLSASGDTLTGTMNVTGAGVIRIYTDAATSLAPLTVTVVGDAVNRYAVTANGGIEFGSGTAVRDTNLYRSGVSQLKTDDDLEVALDLTVGGDIIHASQLDFIAGGAVGASVISSGLYLPPGKTVRFEGTTSDANEIDLTAADATADRTITLPDSTGTVALTNSGFSTIANATATTTTISSTTATAPTDIAGMTFTFTPTYDENVFVQANILWNQSSAPAASVALIGKIIVNGTIAAPAAYTGLAASHGTPSNITSPISHTFAATSGASYTVKASMYKSNGNGTYAASNLSSMSIIRVRS
jgi:hypothetical protein